MTALVDAVPERALAVYAHPDDAEISCGGTLARWASAGCELAVLTTTRGDKGTVDPSADLGALAAVRAAESRAAADLLGVAVVQHLPYGDGELEDDRALRGAIVEHVRRLRPDIVLCPDPTAVFFGGSYYNHRDHRATGWATLDAVAPAAANPHYFAEHLVAGLGVHQVRSVFLSGTLAPDSWVDIGATLEAKIDALFCHASQLTETGDWFREFLRASAEEAGRAAGIRYAEAFRRIDLVA
jgi:LmbE family N-acetylglucosaminyl deacetylase